MIAYEYASNFQQGIAVVKNNGNFGVIKNTDIKIIENKYTDDIFKQWKVKFSQSIQYNSKGDEINAENMGFNYSDIVSNIEVKDSQGNIMDVSLQFRR